MHKSKRSTYIILTLLFFFVPPVLLSSLGIQLHTVTTGSMRPGIKPGAVVVTKLVEAHAIKKGHVILYFDTQTNNPVSHRVIAVSQKGNQVSLTTKGDANAESDPTILEPSSVPIATVIWVIPGAGFLVSALHSTIAKLGVLLFFLLLMVSSYYYEKSRKERQQDESVGAAADITTQDEEKPLDSHEEIHLQEAGNNNEIL